MKFITITTEQGMLCAVNIANVTFVEPVSNGTRITMVNDAEILTNCSFSEIVSRLNFPS
jgi:hypothetical protein